MYRRDGMYLQSLHGGILGVFRWVWSLCAIRPVWSCCVNFETVNTHHSGFVDFDLTTEWIVLINCIELTDRLNTYMLVCLTSVLPCWCPDWFDWLFDWLLAQLL